MGKRTPRIKLPGQSWTIKEKLDVVNALCADRHFSHGEARAAVTMVLYFHNTASGDLFPSREQVSEQCGVSKHIVIGATRKMKCFGYLHYDQTSGGRNERNTYHLKKLSPKVVNLHPEMVQKLHGIESETVQKLHPPSAETAPAPVQNLHPHIPLESTTCKEEGEASPLPCNSRASASQKKEQDASRKEEVIIHRPNHQPPSPPAGPTDEQRAANVAKLDEFVRKHRGVSAK
jgi:hypothetical protein